MTNTAPARKLWFTSDLHMGHESCVRWEHEAGLLPAEVKTADDRDGYILDRWNMRVGPKDEVWIVGDFAYRNTKPIEWYVNRMNGTLHLIKGNHDDKGAWKERHLFASAHEAHYLKYYGVRMYLHHYPCLTWRSSQHGTYHIHGHCHGDLKAPGRSIDVGIMCHSYRPISFGQICDRVVFEPEVTHHPKSGDVISPSLPVTDQSTTPMPPVMEPRQ